MLRGKTLFKCDDCGRRFRAPEIEYKGSAASMPQPCPDCGSLHTYPARDWFFARFIYHYVHLRMKPTRD